MIQITISTENDDKVVVSEMQNGVIVGGTLEFDQLIQVRDVTLFDLFQYWQEIRLLNQVPFGELLTGKRMLQENVYARKESDFRKRLKEYVKETLDSSIISVKTEIDQKITEDKLEHYNRYKTCPDCHGELFHEYKNEKHHYICKVCNSGFGMNVPTFSSNAISMWRIT